jgi:hypothetical protein
VSFAQLEGGIPTVVAPNDRDGRRLPAGLERYKDNHHLALHNLN